MTIKYTKFFLFLLFVTLSSTHAFIADSGSSDQGFMQLSDWQWQYRILVIDTQNAPSIPILLTLLQDNRQMIEERSLKVLLITEMQVLELFAMHADSEKKQFSQAEIKGRLGDKKAVLIGLDGGVKSFYNLPIALSEVYADIDGMPMRQQELLRNAH